MEWTDIRLTVAKADADNAEAVATLIKDSVGILQICSKVWVNGLMLDFNLSSEDSFQKPEGE